MKLWRSIVLTILILCSCRFAPGLKLTQLRIIDVYPNKARYAPRESVALQVVLKGPDDAGSTHATLQVAFWHLGDRIGRDISRAVTISGPNPKQVTLSWLPPVQDFTGYFVDVRLIGPDGREMDRSQTAIDVSSEWNRFPRYGYLAHYSTAEGARPNQWIAELNKFHIDGLQFYDFQNRHEQPLAGSIEHPDARWFDIAGREIDRDVLNAYLAAARQRNMVSMAYNSSYSAYADAFTDRSGVRLQWATWDNPGGPRTLQTAKALDLPQNWKTRRLVYMDQNSQAWQNYLFGKMANLFRAYPFDGWHIDTFGTHGAYAYDGSYVDFIGGFRPFIDRAKEMLHKRVVLNTVGTRGQEQTAQSRADFVYSELWEDHDTYASILAAAQQVHTANPDVGLVFAAYLHRRDGKDQQFAKKAEFNLPSVLLADAAIFASGASHIELGDGGRMLSKEYFPEDAELSVSPELYSALRHYYDFLTAYENILRYRVMSDAAIVDLPANPHSEDGTPNRVWTISLRKGGRTIVHLINLLGSEDAQWRDIAASRPDAPQLTDIRVRVNSDQTVTSAGWATPDSDGGRFHPLPFAKGIRNGERYVDVTLPSLKYWDVLVIQHRSGTHGGKRPPQ